MIEIKDLPIEQRLALAASVRDALTGERVSAKGNTELISEIDEKLNSLNTIYDLDGE